MSDQMDKLVESIDELKVKIPSLLDLIDEVIAHETRFRAIDEKTAFVLTQLKKIRVTLDELPLDHKKLNELVKDDNNVTVAIVLFEKILSRKDVDIKKYIKECIFSADVSEFIGEAVVKNKEGIADFVWKSLEKKLQMCVGKRVIAGIISIGVILGVIFMVLSYLQKYI